MSGFWRRLWLDHSQNCTLQWADKCPRSAFWRESRRTSLDLSISKMLNSKLTTQEIWIFRDLFNPILFSLCSFIQKELTKSQTEASKRWGFDFSRGEPLRDHSQFVWKRVPPTVMPEMFTLSRAAHCREIPGVSSGDASDCEDMSPEQDLMDSRAHNEHRQQEMTPACSSSRCLKKERATRQPKITGKSRIFSHTSPPSTAFSRMLAHGAHGVN